MVTNAELLTPTEYKRLEALFDDCDPAHPDDTEFFEYGNHRNLYNYITGQLRMDCPSGRGPVYHYAAKILRNNRAVMLSEFFHCPLDLAVYIVALESALGDNIGLVQEQYKLNFSMAD